MTLRQRPLPATWVAERVAGGQYKEPPVRRTVVDIKWAVKPVFVVFLRQFSRHPARTTRYEQILVFH